MPKQKEIVIRMTPKTLDNAIETLNAARKIAKKKCLKKRSTAEDFFTFGTVMGLLHTFEYVKEHAKEFK